MHSDRMLRERASSARAVHVQIRAQSPSCGLNKTTWRGAYLYIDMRHRLH